MKHFYIVHTKGIGWEVVSPIRRRYAFSLEEAIEMIMSK